MGVNPVHCESNTALVNKKTLSWKYRRQFRTKTLLWTWKNVILVNQKSNFEVWLLNAVTPDPGNVKALENTKSTNDKDELKSFICQMQNNDARCVHDALMIDFIPSIAYVVAPTWETLLLDKQAPRTSDELSKALAIVYFYLILICNLRDSGLFMLGWKCWSNHTVSKFALASHQCCFCWNL